MEVSVSVMIDDECDFLGVECGEFWREAGFEKRPFVCLTSRC